MYIILCATLYKEWSLQKPELSSGRQAPCSTGLITLLCECSRNPSVSVYQLALLWEAAFGFSEFILKTRSTHLPISRWVIYKCTCPHCTECSAVLDQKQHDPRVPPNLFTWSHPAWHFLLPRMKKALLKGKHFAMWKRQKKGLSTKRHKNQQVQKWFWAVEKTSQ